MQTATARGMMTMEQSLAQLVLRRVITKDVALACSSRADQLEGLLERAGFEDEHATRRRCCGWPGADGAERREARLDLEEGDVVPAQAADESAPDGSPSRPRSPSPRQPGSIWKKEISLRKPEQDAAPAEPDVVDVEPEPAADPAHVQAPEQVEPEPVAVLEPVAVVATEPAFESEPAFEAPPAVEHSWLTKPLEEVSAPPEEPLDPIHAAVEPARRRSCRRPSRRRSSRPDLGSCRRPRPSCRPRSS